MDNRANSRFNPHNNSLFDPRNNSLFGTGNNTLYSPLNGAHDHAAPGIPEVADEDAESEATMVFSRTVDREFNRSLKQGGPDFHGSSLRRRINFDDTFMSERSNANTRLIETEEEVATLKRLLKRNREELARVQGREKAANAKIAELEKNLKEAQDQNAKFRRAQDAKDSHSAQHKKT
ncbi:hypothetical protein L596_013186 [Steinernema carpocapsae]|uniref:Uncharacterized protein n=1 Tax=Steinernema carpocapsae TaxID=34508 RepID=A0A4V6A505_STECR|nr:hypothetical protein L596_013186 [Steinernema carpocapsae]